MAHKIPHDMNLVNEYYFNKSKFLIEKYSLINSSNPFHDLAGLYIRRGDKLTKDSFWHKHNRWRNLSYYVKGIVYEKKRRKITFKCIFVMTDELYTREHLHNRNILYNMLAPQICFNPFQRIDFDQFLISMRYLIYYTDSNVFQYFHEVIHAQRQQPQGIQSYTFSKNALDSL
ncbi:unnamed protein product [Adineta steineri]|uniref:Uncharacterized protein n=2 Tax=Adineta steineri TaxID=433720 RepID=A0A818PEX6_9BILA|nr:unnamed protein product [Adineta steineri]